VRDPTLENSWLAVANARDVPAGAAVGVELLDRPLVLWRTVDGVLGAADDQCPHRGAMLSRGEVRGERLMCPYHGWQYDAAGVCRLQPATPTLTPPPHIRLTSFEVRERYGVVWVALGEPPDDLEFFPEYDEPGARHVHHEPAWVEACGPRIIENFLDMAHFPFVHTGVLGAEPHTEVRDYTVKLTAAGLEVTDCVFWQPAATPTSEGGVDVDYAYRVPHPYVATLTKLPQADVPGFSLMLVASPASEARCRAWMIASFTDPTVSEQDFHDFNQRIFLQDIPILESERPKRIPLDPRSELHQAADQASLAYRKYLRTLGVRCGTSLADD
jgi:phenylpropionate dioxygenase-like ring-hydroxylating dioxygenase large terminal subunit